MTAPSSWVERLADWAAGLSIADIPDDVLELARTQRRSVFGAIAASSEDAATARVVRSLATTTDDAVYAASAASIALDFDDYVCFAHAGHSAVLVPILLGAELGSSGEEQLVAQIAANEIEARLGGACLIGPLNGQLWAFIHAAGAAIASARLQHLSSEQTAHALALSLYQVNRPTVPGFMAPDSKLLTAGEPSLLGMRSARLAASGVTGPLDVLDHPHGFFAAFSYAPIKGLLQRLGEGWALRTLSVKEYPGCAYIDTTIDSLGELNLPEPDAIDRVDVRAGLLTCGMDRLSEKYQTDSPTPVTVTFSIPWNVAIFILAGRLTPDQLTSDWLKQHSGEISALSRKVHLHHDPEASLASLRGFLPLLPANRIKEEIGRGRLLRAIGRARRDHPRLKLRAGDLRTFARIRSSTGSNDYWSDDALRNFRMTFPARVDVRLRDGRVLSARTDVPRGGAGNRTRSPHDVARDKLLTWGTKRWDDPHVLDKEIEQDSAILADRLARD